MLGPLDHPLAVVVGHFRIAVARRRRRSGFFDVDQAKLRLFGLAVADIQQDGKAQPTERAAALHPIRGIEYLDLGIIRPGL
jgi:hypothetical protein